MIPETKKLIANFFSTIQEGEKIIEIKRNNLNKSYDFEPFILFNRLDQFRNNYLTEDNFINFLKLNNIESTINEAKYLILFYDSDFTQNLNYNQFLNLVLSKDYYEIRNSINSKIEENLNNSNDNSDNSISYISYETEKLFSELLKSEFDLIKQLDLILSKIKFNGDFSLSELFNEISISGIVISSKLNKFLNENDINLNDNDIKLILKRCDIKKNGRVDLFDLEKIFYFPFSSPPNTFNSRKNTPKLYKNLNKIPVLDFKNSNNNYIRNEYKKYYVSNSKNKNLENYQFNNNNNINFNHDNSNINNSNINNSNINNSNIYNSNNNSNINNSNNNSNINNSIINNDDDFEKKYDKQFKKTFFNKNLHLNNIENYNNNKYNKMKNPFKLSYNNSTKNFCKNNQSNYNNDSFLNDKSNINKKIITQYKFPSQKNTSYNTPNFNNSFSTQFNSDPETFQRSTSQTNIHNHIPNQIKIFPLCNYNNYKQNFKHYRNNKQPRFQNYIFNTENYKNIQKKISTTLSLRLSPIRKIKNNINYNNNLNNSQINIFNNNKIKEFTEFDLLNFLQNLMNIEFEIEKEKIEISSNKDYNIEDIFSYFETNNTENNILSPKDLLNGFHNLNLNFNINDLNLILSRFDLLNLGGLSYPDFFDMLVPFDKNIRDDVENRFSYGLNNNTIEQLRNLFILILNSEKRIFEMKKYIKSLNNVDLNFVFNNISFNNFYANDKNLENYFKVNGIFFDQRGIDLLFIRLDKDRDGKFNYDDLKREIFL